MKNWRKSTGLMGYQWGTNLYILGVPDGGGGEAEEREGEKSQNVCKEIMVETSEI